MKKVDFSTVNCQNSPGKSKIRTFCWLYFYFCLSKTRNNAKFGIFYQSENERFLSEIAPLPPVKQPKIYQNPIELALKYRQMMKDHNLNQSRLAEKLNISRVRVTQILNLLKIDPWISKQINQKNLQIPERQLRPLASENRTVQKGKFKELLKV